ELKVTDYRLARNHELVHEHHPRTHLHASRVDEIADAAFGGGPNLEVVVDDGRLPVEQEAREPVVALEEIEQAVDEVNELQPIDLERRVPLAVPMSMGNDPHLSWRRDLRLRVQEHRSSPPCAEWRESETQGERMVNCFARRWTRPARGMTITPDARRLS